LPNSKRFLNIKLNSWTAWLTWKSLKTMQPGIATAIVPDEMAIWEKYAGFANLSGSAHIQNNARFSIVSQGKQFTDLAIFTPVEENKLKLSRDIRRGFPALHPTIKEKITILDLLKHTSGTREGYDLWTFQKPIANSFRSAGKAEWKKLTV
jgi:CubicO group peptidase (beta-lactamase class C family)